MFTRAEEGAARAGMALLVAALRLRRARLLGDRALEEQALAWMSEAGVVAPDRVTRVMVP